MTAMAYWTSSMYRDLAKSRRIEADEIIGDWIFLIFFCVCMYAYGLLTVRRDRREILWLGRHQQMSVAVSARTDKKAGHEVLKLRAGLTAAAAPSLPSCKVCR
jgi:hypothetical protein